jgi:ABC-2 type transport system permease protein
MQVFKLCLKIIKKNIPVMLIYVVVFFMVSLSITLSATSRQPEETSFNIEKADIAFISQDDSPLINGLKNELMKIVNFIDIPDETEALQDALFFRRVSYIIRVPEGFTENFMEGKDISLIKTMVPNSIANTYIDICINKYFNAAKLYISLLPGITQEELVRNLKSDLSVETIVEFQPEDVKYTNHTYVRYYFNNLAYTLLSVIILGMSAIIIAFNDRDLRMRNFCSPIRYTAFNLQFIYSNLLFTFAIWFVMTALCIIVSDQNSLNVNTVCLILNTFVFSLCCCSIGFLIGNLVSKNAIPAVCNVVTLGSCFISGVFVPQEFIGNAVLKAASFTPAYWFVKANDSIVELTKFDFSYTKGIFSDMLIQLGFALTFFSIALAIRKKKELSA